MAVRIAESKQPRKGRKAVSHIEIHPRLGGGHIVKHVYTGYEHQAKEVHFNEDGKTQGGEHVTKHVMKHAGLPKYDKQDESETEEEIEA